MRLLEEMTWADKGKEGTEAGVASLDHILRGILSYQLQISGVFWSEFGSIIGRNVTNRTPNLLWQPFVSTHFKHRAPILEVQEVTHHSQSKAIRQEVTDRAKKRSRGRCCAIKSGAGCAPRGLCISSGTRTTVAPAQFGKLVTFD